MIEQITTLTPEQAQRALLLFYDLLPCELFEDQKKPSLARIETLADRLQEGTTEKIKTFLSILRTKDDTECKGEVAKILLQTFSQNDLLLPYIKQAVEGAVKPHMAPIPLFIGAFLIGMAIISRDVDIKTPNYRIKTTINPKTIEALTDTFEKIITAFPLNLWEKIKGLFGL